MNLDWVSITLLRDCCGPRWAAPAVLQPDAGWQTWEPAEEGPFVLGSSPPRALGALLHGAQRVKSPWFSKLHPRAPLTSVN